MRHFMKHLLLGGLLWLLPWTVLPQAAQNKEDLSAMVQVITKNGIPFDENSLRTAERSPNSYERATLYQRYADYQQQQGSIETGHEYYWKAIRIYEQLNKPTEQSYCYYQLATGYYQLSDIKAIASIVKTMRQLAESRNDKRIRYDYFSVCAVYYEMLRQQQPDQPRWHDSIEYYNIQSINIIEKMSAEEMHAAQIKPVWNFYNHAIFYDHDDAPPVVDSIKKYLDKAEKYVALMNYTGWERDECYISIYDEKAWLYYYKKEYKKAEAEMFNVIRLLDTVDQYSPNTVLIEREQAYSFLAMLYEETNRPVEALKYQKLVSDVAQKRYNLDTQNSIHQLMVQYEVEKQNSEISHLQAENKAARKAFWLTVSLCIISFIVILLLIWVFKLRNTNIKRRLYEKELENENIQQELQYQTQEKTLLSQEYERLKQLADRSQENAEIFKTNLDQIHQRLNESHSQTVINHIIEKVRLSSALDEIVKYNYITLLEKLKPEQIDHTIGTATQNLTSLDIKYIISFMIGMTTEDIAHLFSISTDSVYSVRHRIRKKFSKKANLPF